MGKFITFIARSAQAQIFALFAVFLFVIGAVNEVVSFFSLPWLPRWAPQVLGGVLIYSAFQSVAFQVDKAVQDLNSKVAAIVPSEVSSTAVVVRTGTPDLSLANTIKAVSESRWAAAHKPTPEAVIQEIRDKLNLGRITAFGRRYPEGVIGPIATSHWAGYRLEPNDACAVTDDGTPGYYDIQFDKTYVQLTWPKAGGGWA